MFRRLLFLSIIGCIAASCAGRADKFEKGETLYAPGFASGFEISACGEGSVITVRNPWQGAQDVEMDYYLAPVGTEVPKGFSGTVINVPVTRAVCMSSTYIAFLDALGSTDAVKGVSGLGFISNDKIHAAASEGRVRDVGYDTNLNYELIAAINPDVVFIYGVSGENTALTGKLAEMGIKTMYIGDYCEESPLGKAEWIVAFGELLGQRDVAEGIFAGIRDSYMSTVEMVKESQRNWQMISSSGRDRSPRVMINAPWRDVWFVPGDRSYMVRLIEDAGGKYVCGGKDTDISRPISAESAFVYASKADIWINPGSHNSMADLKASDPRFSDIPSVRNNQVYNCNRRRTPSGGSDFWESGAVRPDIVLLDLASLLNRCLMPDHELYYYEVLE